MADKERKGEAPEEERNKPYERFEDALRKLAQVPKEEKWTRNAASTSGRSGRADRYLRRS